MSKMQRIRPDGYKCWENMRSRVNNPNATGYADYGGRGIKIDPHWETFKQFIKDMGPRPCGTTLHRLNVNGDYSPKNCRWATHKEQARNKRNTSRFTFNGKTQAIADWAEEVKLPAMLLWQRLVRLQWPVEKALLTPKKHYVRHTI